MAVYFFYGEEEFSMGKEVEKFKKKLDQNFLDMSYKKYDNPKFADFIALLRTQPMMFGSMLTVIDVFGFLSATLEDKQIQEISDALDSCHENSDIILTAVLPRGEGKKLDSRKKLFKLFSKFNPQEFASLPTYKIAELTAELNKLARGKSVKLSGEAATALITQVGNNLRQLDSELDKLKLFAAPSDLITEQMVHEICVSNEDVFALSDYIMQNQKDSALLEYRRLLDNKHPLEIISLLQTMLRQWIAIKANSGKLSGFDLSKKLGMHEFRIKLAAQKLKDTNLKQLITMKKNLTDTEYRIKAGLTFDVEKEVENAIIFR